MLTAGVMGFSVAGEEVGDELRARFLPFRGRSGETAVERKFCLLSHMILSLGDTCKSSST